MKLGWSFFVMGCAVLGGCGRDGSAADRAASRERQIAQHQCASNLAIYAPGMTPARPYRIVGPVEGSWGMSVESRFQRMKKSACELGANGIIDAGEHEDVVAESSTTTMGRDAWGRPVAIVEHPTRTVRRVRGLAVVFE